MKFSDSFLLLYGMDMQSYNVLLL